MNRLVSLVPCISYSLLRLGAGNRLVGVTRYCPLQSGPSPSPSPSPDVSPQPAVVGGIHDIDFELLASLKPDLVLADPEENGRANIERLRREFPLEQVVVKNVNDSLEHLRRLGAILGALEEAERLVRRFRRMSELQSADRSGRGVAPAQPIEGLRRVAVLVWNAPWMAVGQGTYADALLEHRGMRNVVKVAGYPRVELDELAALAPDTVLLPSEPCDFTAADESRLARAFGPKGARLQRCDGRDLFWYGAWMAGAVG